MRVRYGSLDLDTLIRARYPLGCKYAGRFVTPEPLASGGNSYPAMNGKPDSVRLDRLVSQTARYFREQDDAVRAEA